jgi:tetratricopeptide (TPR) repeat protein
MATYIAALPPGQRVLTTFAPPQFVERLNMDLLYIQSRGYETAATECQEFVRPGPKNNTARSSRAEAHLILYQANKNMPYLGDSAPNQRQDPDEDEIQGSADHELERFADAMTAFQSSVDVSTKICEARNKLGFCPARPGEADEAIELFPGAGRHKAGALDAAYEIGLLQTEENGRKTAQSELQQSQQGKKQSQPILRVDTLNEQGSRLMGQGKLREAVEVLGEALRLNPGDARTYYNLSLAYAELDDRAAEQAALTQALQSDPKFAKAHNRLGLRYMEDGKTVNAEKEFKAALEVNPKFAEAESNLGILYGHEGKISEAEALFRKAQADDPRCDQAFIGLGLTLTGQGRLEEAKQEFQLASEISPEGVYTALGTTEGKLGNWKEAAEIFQKAVRLRPTSVDARLNLGVALANGYDQKGALEQFSEAVRLNPGSPVARYNKGRTLYDLGRLEEARSELETTCKLNPNYPAALYLLAETVRDLGDPQKSTELLESLVKLAPANAEAQSLLGQNLLRLGRTDEAIEHLRRAVEADPEDSRALYNLSQTLKKFGKPQADQYLARFEELKKQRQISDRVSQLGIFALAAADARDWTEAIEDTKEALQICGDCRFNAVLHRNLGFIYCRKGDLEDGKRELEAALKLKPDDPDALKALEMAVSLLGKPNAGN